MFVVAVSVLLMLAAAAGMVFTVLSGTGLTVDTLFFVLILGVMFVIFAGNALYELRALRARRAGKAPGKADKPAASAASNTAAAETKPGAAAPRQPELPRARPVVQLSRKPASPPRAVEGLRPGGVLIKEEVLRRANLAINAQPYCSGWELVQCDCAGDLERPICERRWDLFKIVGSIERGAFGLGRKRAVTRALSKLLALVAAQGRNGFEVSRITDLNLAGVHYVTVVGQARHIQAKPFVLETPEKPSLVAMAQPVIGTEDEAQVAPAEAA